MNTNEAYACAVNVELRENAAYERRPICHVTQTCRNLAPPELSTSVMIEHNEQKYNNEPEVYEEVSAIAL